jgi:hypothetical protein
VVAPTVLGGRVVIPIPSPSCPGFGGNGADLNPIDHIPVIGDAAHLVSALGGMVRTVLGWIANPGQAAHDIVGWITWNTVGWNPDSPSCYDPTSAYGFARSVVAGDVQLDASSLYHDAYSALALVSLIVVCAAAIARIVHSSHEQRTHWGSALAETALRAVAGFAAIQLGYAVLGWLVPLFSDLAGQVFVTFAAIAVPDPGGFDPLGALLFTGLLRLPQLGLVAIVLIPVLLFQLIRFVLLMVIRFIVISFGIAAAPLFIALAVFDHRAQVVEWWWRMMLGALVAPVVAAAMIGLTVGLSVRTAFFGQSVSSVSFGPLVSVILVIGGLWLTGRAEEAQPGQAFSAFRASPQGDRFIGEVTAGLMPPSLTPGARWAAVEALPGLDAAMRRLRLSVHSQSTRTGRLEVAPAAWAAFDHAVTSAWPRRTGAPPDAPASPPPPPAPRPPRSSLPPPDVRP